MDKDTEREIAEGLREGDREAWLRFYEAYADRIWKNVARIMGFDSIAVDDVVQETFLAAARSAKNFDSRRGSLWIWLSGIARKQIALYYRKQAPETKLSQAKEWWDSLGSERINRIVATSDLPLDILEAEELAVLIRCILRELSADHQALLLAKYVDEQPVEDIANDMNCSSIAVRSKLVRAKGAFRGAFKRLTQSISGMKESLL